MRLGTPIRAAGFRQAVSRVGLMTGMTCSAARKCRARRNAAFQSYEAAAIRNRGTEQTGCRDLMQLGGRAAVCVTGSGVRRSECVSERDLTAHQALYNRL